MLGEGLALDVIELSTFLLEGNGGVLLGAEATDLVEGVVVVGGEETGVTSVLGGVALEVVDSFAV
jgi:hypothetical protein